MTFYARTRWRCGGGPREAVSCSWMVALLLSTRAQFLALPHPRMQTDLAARRAPAGRGALFTLNHASHA